MNSAIRKYACFRGKISAYLKKSGTMKYIFFFAEMSTECNILPVILTFCLIFYVNALICML